MKLTEDKKGVALADKNFFLAGMTNNAIYTKISRTNFGMTNFSEFNFKVSNHTCLCKRSLGKLLKCITIKSFTFQKQSLAPMCTKLTKQTCYNLYPTDPYYYPYY